MCKLKYGGWEREDKEKSCVSLKRMAMHCSSRRKQSKGVKRAKRRRRKVKRQKVVLLPKRVKVEREKRKVRKWIHKGHHHFFAHCASCIHLMWYVFLLKRTTRIYTYISTNIYKFSVWYFNLQRRKRQFCGKKSNGYGISRKIFFCDQLTRVVYKNLYTYVYMV